MRAAFVCRLLHFIEWELSRERHRCISPDTTTRSSWVSFFYDRCKQFDGTRRDFPSPSFFFFFIAQIPPLSRWRQTPWHVYLRLRKLLYADGNLNMVCVAPCDPALALQQITGYIFHSSIKVAEYACLPLIWSHNSCCSSEMMKCTSLLFPAALPVTLISTSLLFMHVRIDRSFCSEWHHRAKRAILMRPWGLTGLRSAALHVIPASDIIKLNDSSELKLINRGSWITKR